MDTPSITRIESALAIRLPDAYRQMMLSGKIERLGDCGLFTDPEVIIERTREHRAGYAGAPKWSDGVVYIGDQEDACGFALDCKTGVVVQSDHGNLVEAPMARYETIDALVAELASDLEKPAQSRPWWKFWT